MDGWTDGRKSVHRDMVPRVPKCKLIYLYYNGGFSSYTYIFEPPFPVKVNFEVRQSVTNFSQDQNQQKTIKCYMISLNIKI